MLLFAPRISPLLNLTIFRPGCATHQQRASFLGHAVHRLGLSAEILELREEKLPDEAWKQAVAQAVWSPEVWMDRARRLVQPSGIIYVLSSEPVDPRSLPEGLILEREESCIRPVDRKSRYVSVVRK